MSKRSRRRCVTRARTHTCQVQYVHACRACMHASRVRTMASVCARTRRCSVCMRVRTQHAARAAFHGQSLRVRASRHAGHSIAHVQLARVRYSVLGIFELEYGCIYYCARRGSTDMISNHATRSACHWPYTRCDPRDQPCVCGVAAS